MRSRILTCVAVAAVAALCSFSFVRAQPKADKPDKPDRGDLPDFVCSELRVQEFPAVNYFYTQQETTLKDIGQAIPDMMNQLMEAIAGGEVNVVGPPIFVYEGATGEMDKPFQLHVGFPVAPGQKPAGDLKVRGLEKYRCATMLYSGPTAHVGEAYQRIFPQIIEAGLEPAGGSREMHLYWEGPESPNNIMLIQVAVK